MDFRTQLQRRPYGGLPIRFDGPVFQLHPRRQIRATLVGKRCQLKWASYFFPKAVSTVKRVSGSAHTLGREQGSDNPFRAAYAVATFFHGVSSPERVTRRGRLEAAAMPMAWAVAWMESFKRLETPAAVATPIAYPWSQPRRLSIVASLRRAKISYTTIMLVRNSFPSTFIVPAKAKSAPRQSLGCPPG